jgi:plasmid maintenance system killer protein
MEEFSPVNFRFDERAGKGYEPPLSLRAPPVYSWVRQPKQILRTAQLLLLGKATLSEGGRIRLLDTLNSAKLCKRTWKPWRQWNARAANILAVLDAASSALDLAGPGNRLHELQGDHEGVWSVTVSGNWRITFRFTDGNAHDVDLIDYP